MSTDPKGRWVWHEVMSTDMGAASEYYRGLFQWSADKGPMTDMNYLVFKAGDRMVAGIGEAQGPMSHWLSYVGVEDVDASAKRVPELGGTVLAAPFDIPNVGRASIIQDPTGGTVALFSSPTTEGGPDYDAKPEMGSVCWVELMTKDLDAAAAFYTELVGWSASDMGPGVKLLKMGEAMVATIRALPAEAPTPPHWADYILVEDVDESVKASEALGGKTLMTKQVIEGMGEFAVLQDPSGAGFAVWKETGSS